MKKVENEKKHGDGPPVFQMVVSRIWEEDFIKLKDLQEYTSASKQTVNESIRILKSFNLINSTSSGYNKRPRFNKFLKKFRVDNPDFMD
jgi:predicted transcriptional regulator